MGPQQRGRLRIAAGEIVGHALHEWQVGFVDRPVGSVSACAGIDEQHAALPDLARDEKGHLVDEGGQHLGVRRGVEPRALAELRQRQVALPASPIAPKSAESRFHQPSRQPWRR